MAVNDRTSEEDIMTYISAALVLLPIGLAAVTGLVAKYSPPVTDWLLAHHILAPADKSVVVIMNGAGIGIMQIVCAVVIFLALCIGAIALFPKKKQ